MNPILSVIMPVFNAQEFLHESIPSILNQTFTDFEFIIIDDGSTDNSIKILNSYAEKDKRVKVFSDSVNLGHIIRLNQGILSANGKFIARMDADDISHPERFQTQIELLENDSDIVLCGSWGSVINSDRKLEYPSEDNDIESCLLDFNPFIHSSVIFRKSVVENNGLYYKEDYLPAEDYKLWTELTKYGRFCIIEKHFIGYRFSPFQVSNRFSHLLEKNNERIKHEYLSESLGLQLPNLFQYHLIESWTELFKLLKFWDLALSKNTVTRKFDINKLNYTSYLTQRKFWESYFNSSKNSFLLVRLQMLIL